MLWGLTFTDRIETLWDFRKHICSLRLISLGSQSESLKGSSEIINFKQLGGLS
jgi:hypothetical protein